MTDPFEKFVRQNKDEFDIHEPSADLFNKVKLPDVQESKVVKINWWAMIGKAAAIILLCVSSVIMYEWLRPKDNLQANKPEIENEPAVTIEIPELVEAEAFYASLIAAHIEELKQYPHFYAEIEVDLLADLADLDEEYNYLLNELGNNVENTQIIETLIQNLRLKVSILERVLDNIEKAELKNKQSNNETTTA